MTTADRGTDTDRLGWHVRLLLGGYPPWWRLRYDDEMRETLLALRAGGEQRGPGLWDLASGLVDAWLHPTLTAPEAHMSPQTTRLVSRTAWGLLLLVLAGSAFAKVVEDPAFATAAVSHPALGWSLDVVRAAALGCCAVMVLAAVTAFAAVLRLPVIDRKRCLLLLGVVPASFAGWLVAVAVARLVTDSTAIHSPQHVAAFVGLAAATVTAGVFSTAALLQVAVRLPQRGVVRRLRSAALVATGALVTAAATAVTAWTLIVAEQSPHLLRADQGLLATPTVITVIAVVAGLIAAASLCGRSAVDVLSSRADAPRSSR